MTTLEPLISLILREAPEEPPEVATAAITPVVAERELVQEQRVSSTGVLEEGTDEPAAVPIIREPQGWACYAAKRPASFLAVQRVSGQSHT